MKKSSNIQIIIFALLCVRTGQNLVNLDISGLYSYIDFIWIIPLLIIHFRLKTNKYFIFICTLLLFAFFIISEKIFILIGISFLLGYMQSILHRETVDIESQTWENHWPLYFMSSTPSHKNG